jgi:hypothetical protein
VRTKLASGEIAVAGDQWPMLVYENQRYDHDDPWNGLFKSHLLVCVGLVPVFFVSYVDFVAHRLLSMCLRRQARWIKR